MTHPDTMRQTAPYPHALADLLTRFSYSAPGREWAFTLADVDRGQGSVGLTLTINITGPDSNHPDKIISVNHYQLVPPAAYNERSWRHWLLEQISLVEFHERLEFFRLDGRVVWPPAHGPGNNPYLLLEPGSDLDRRTKFTGEVNPE